MAQEFIFIHIHNHEAKNKNGEKKRISRNVNEKSILLRCWSSPSCAAMNKVLLQLTNGEFWEKFSFRAQKKLIYAPKAIKGKI
jgi:hypothetical protein